jgi:hypothetical protein
MQGSVNMGIKSTIFALLFGWAFAADLLRMNILNNCKQQIWVESLNNPNHAPHADGIVHLLPSESHDYKFPN